MPVCLSVRRAGYRRGRVDWPGAGQPGRVAAQRRDDAARLRALGARQVAVCGNLKFDITPPPQAAALAAQLRQWRGNARCGWRPAPRAKKPCCWTPCPPTARRCCCLTPRHPQRFAEVAELLRARGIPVQRRSDNTALRADTRVWLGDSMGCLPTIRPSIWPLSAATCCRWAGKT